MLKMRLRLLAFVSIAFLYSSPAEAGAILFDTAHGEKFLLEKSGPLDLSELRSIFVSHRLELKNNDTPFSDDALAAADGVVLSGPFTPVSDEESDALVRFVKRGGKLAIMLHIAGPATELIHRLGVDVSNGVVHEQHDVIDGNTVNFRVTRLRHHPLFTNVKQFSLFGGWALTNINESAGIIASTGDQAWVDLNGDRTLSEGDAVQAFGVAVAGTSGKGEFIVFGDDAIFQNRFLKDDNHRMAANLAAWFAGNGATSSRNNLQ